MNQFLANGKEFALIEKLFDPSHFSKTGRGLGDDAYLLDLGGETLAISTDSSVENVHFNLHWCSIAEALEKALLSNLSDINAMGAKTEWVFFNLGAKKNWTDEEYEPIATTLARLEKDYGFRIVGGDTVKVPKEADCFFTFTVIGKISGQSLLRSQAKPGHKIYVSGELGRSAAGLSLFQKGKRIVQAGGQSQSLSQSQSLRQGQGGNRDQLENFFLSAHLLPRPPLLLGPALAQIPSPIAALDISDGLSSELGHLSRQSDCRMVVEWSKLPYSDQLPLLVEDDSWMNWVLSGGEDYLLLFTGNFSDSELKGLQMKNGISDLGMENGKSIFEIGSVMEGEGVGLIDELGQEKELIPQGWSH